MKLRKKWKAKAGRNICVSSSLGRWDQSKEFQLLHASILPCTVCIPYKPTVMTHSVSRSIFLTSLNVSSTIIKNEGGMQKWILTCQTDLCYSKERKLCNRISLPLAKEAAIANQSKSLLSNEFSVSMQVMYQCQP